MRTIKKRTEITVKTHRLLVTNRHSSIVRALCEECGKEVEMITPEEAAAIGQVTCRAIYRAIEAGEIHIVEMPVVFVCFNSLLEFLNRNLPANDQAPYLDKGD